MRTSSSLFKKIYAVILILCICAYMTACHKQDEWLDAKSNKSDIVPKTLEDFQGMLDYFYTMNLSFPGIGLVGADNIVLTDANYNSLPQTERNAYTWQKDIYQLEDSYDWNYGYKVIGYSNLVLEGMSKIERNSSNQVLYDNVKGSALFFRAYAYYSLAQLFCKPYTASSAGTDLGLVLRDKADVNEKAPRQSVAKTYEQMVNDAKMAIDMLPIKPQYQMRPSKPSANGLLAKIYLTMEDYENAFKYSDASLKDFSTLMDFNDKNLASTTRSWRFPSYPSNPEISFYAYQNGFSSVSAFSTGGVGNVSPELYASYESNDLRKSILYVDRGNGNVQWEGNYAGTFSNFCGIATNEILLIRAECYARRGFPSEAIQDLNTLLTKRYVSGTFTPIAGVGSEEALIVILRERRKELPFTGQLRWEDLRRLNKDTRFAVTLTRSVNGTNYTLPANDSRYIYPLPNIEIELNGVQQNIR